MRISSTVVWLLALVTTSTICPAQQRGAWGVDLHNRPVHQLQVDRKASPAAIVLFFLATDCPISNRYIPELQRLESKFAPRGVVFWQVYPNAGETAAGILQHQLNYAFRGAALIHPSARLQAAAAATITPESAILTPAGLNKGYSHAVYLGRIDDRYIDIGRRRPAALQHDLEEALTAVLGKQTVPQPGGPPVGCGIIPESLVEKR